VNVFTVVKKVTEPTNVQIEKREPRQKFGASTAERWDTNHCNVGTRKATKAKDTKDTRTIETIEIM
jgi:hypothetical protein